ncbi:hypothetical protein A2210_01515 [Candidatus Woesebacteria bacterium RIFOXYA1_FULL_40_18]|uniref:Nudix hydrolase domain-containing protein n=2 Tax=Candidatus Woeseibacteriota TaxID=1752722 RepID=A0A1F8CJY7_9BACT|nr:MAG: hypothetical protein A2210_01515 [Candidatus Woesebacteria bacterium RIFOXYA1_FULL_40_18]OGM80239.1 MAG: hypothetical protein A2361_02490 [Candidatus Woesebacteria bacterium RIFOXYB1_FULL_40_26]
MAKTCDNKSVGMLIWKDGKLLLIERKLFPFGFAPPAGHIDDKGSFENAAKEEVQEEVGLNLIKLKLLTEGKKNNKCRREGGSWHYWKIYEVKANGELKPSHDETKQAGWYDKDDIKKLANKTRLYLEGRILEDKWQESPGLESVWYEWFKELGII